MKRIEWVVSNFTLEDSVLLIDVTATSRMSGSPVFVSEEQPGTLRCRQQKTLPSLILSLGELDITTLGDRCAERHDDLWV